MWLRIYTLFCFVISLDEVNHFVHPHASYPWCIAATAGHSVNTQMSAKIIRYPRTMKWNWWNLVYPIYALHSAGLHGTNLEGNHLNVNFVCCSFMKRIYNWALWRILFFFCIYLLFWSHCCRIIWSHVLKVSLLTVSRRNEVTEGFYCHFKT